MTLGKLAIITGRGTLPLEIADTCIQEGREFIMVAFDGHIDEEKLKPYPHIIMPFGPFGKTLNYLKKNKVKDLVLAGKFYRPNLFKLKTDLKTTGFLTRILFKSLGDDSLLKAVTAELEKKGLNVVGVDTILKASLAEEGLLTTKKPSKQDHVDIQKGFETAALLGRADVGQSVIVQNGVVLGVEAIEGTDKLIKRIQDYKLDEKGGVLIKRKKPGQDARLDLPTIGPETLESVHKSSLNGIAIEAGGTLITAREKLIDEANRLGLFIISIKAKS